MAASKPKPPEFTAPRYSRSVSRAVDRATLAHEVALEAGSPNLIVVTGDELRRLEQLIEGDER